MSKTLKRTLAVVMAIAMIFSLSATAFAADNVNELRGTSVPPRDDGTCSTYMMSTTTPSTSINVTLVIEAGNSGDDWEIAYGSAFREEVNVTLTNSTPKSFTVKDLLEAVDGTNNLEFGMYYTLLETWYLVDVSHTKNNVTTTWTAGQWGFDGWVFRINDMYPVQYLPNSVNAYEGSAINEAYIKTGDVVHFFYDFPSTFSADLGDIAAGYIRATDATYDANQGLTAQLQVHKTFIDPSDDNYLYVNDYYDYAGSEISEAYLYDSTGTTYLKTGYVDSATGEVTFAGTLSSGTYIIKTANVIRPVTEDDDELFCDYIDTVYLVYTGAYSKITIS